MSDAPQGGVERIWDGEDCPRDHCGGGVERSETCQDCGRDFNPAEEGYYVDTVDVGPDATGGTAEVFRQDAEKFGEWSGFEEEDIGPWCDDCSWKVQRRRTLNGKRATGVGQDGGTE